MTSGVDIDSISLTAPMSTGTSLPRTPGGYWVVVEVRDHRLLESRERNAGNRALNHRRREGFSAREEEALYDSPMVDNLSKIIEWRADRHCGTMHDLLDLSVKRSIQQSHLANSISDA